MLFVSCSTSDDSSNSSNNTQAVVSTAQSGSWVITSYIDSGQDETNNFSGYTFTFGSNGVLTANSGTTVSVTGTWSVTDSNSNDDNPSDLHFNIFFSSPANFADLTDDWEIVTTTSSRIELIDVSGGNGGTDYLTFEKQ